MRLATPQTGRNIALRAESAHQITTAHPSNDPVDTAPDTPNEGTHLPPLDGGADWPPTITPTIYADDESPVTLRIHALDDPVIRVSGLTSFAASAQRWHTPSAMGLGPRWMTSPRRRERPHTVKDRGFAAMGLLGAEEVSVEASSAWPVVAS